MGRATLKSFRHPPSSLAVNGSPSISIRRPSQARVFGISLKTDRKNLGGRRTLVSRLRMVNAELNADTPPWLILGFVSKGWKFIFAVIR